jgi:hypothetical protein
MRLITVLLMVLIVGLKITQAISAETTELTNAVSVEVLENEIDKLLDQHKDQHERAFYLLVLAARNLAKRGQHDYAFKAYEKSFGLISVPSRNVLRSKLEYAWLSQLQNRPEKIRQVLPDIKDRIELVEKDTLKKDLRDQWEILNMIGSNHSATEIYPNGVKRFENTRFFDFVIDREQTILIKNKKFSLAFELFRQAPGKNSSYSNQITYDFLAHILKEKTESLCIKSLGRYPSDYSTMTRLCHLIDRVRQGSIVSAEEIQQTQEFLARESLDVSSYKVMLEELNKIQISK